MAFTRDGRHLEETPETRSARDTADLRLIYSLVRSRVGHDFSRYKERTFLLRDLLIGVTNFFRDRDGFAAIESVMPRLFEGKGADDTVRVWVPGCATGE